LNLYLAICSVERILIIPKQYVCKTIYIEYINNIKISFIQGDICEENLDAIGESIHFHLSLHYLFIKQSQWNRLFDEK